MENLAILIIALGTSKPKNPKPPVKPCSCRNVNECISETTNWKYSIKISIEKLPLLVRKLTKEHFCENCINFLIVNGIEDLWLLMSFLDVQLHLLHNNKFDSLNQHLHRKFQFPKNQSIGAWRFRSFYQSSNGNRYQKLPYQKSFSNYEQTTLTNNGIDFFQQSENFNLQKIIWKKNWC